MCLGRAIKTLRTYRGMHQRDLAHRMGVTATYISLLESEKREPSWSFLRGLAHELDVSLSSLAVLAEQIARDKAKKT